MCLAAAALAHGESNSRPRLARRKEVVQLRVEAERRSDHRYCLPTLLASLSPLHGLIGRALHLIGRMDIFHRDRA